MFFLIAAALLVAPAPKPVSFGDWIVSCDNVRHCDAIGLPPDGADHGWTILVTRDPTALAEPEIDVEPTFNDEPVPARLMLDGHATPFGFNGIGRSVPPRTLLAAIARARSASLLNGKGSPLGTFPIAGAAAAFRWIDAQQHRVGTATALVATGPRPASAVPPPPPRPRIAQPAPSSLAPRKLSRADLLAIQKNSDLCEPGRAEAVYSRLDDRHTLAIVGCIMGAYQGSAMIVVVDNAGRWTPARIEQADPSEDRESADAWMLAEPDYDPKGRLLHSYGKGRGLGDCGEGGSWAWDGAVFRLASYGSLDECRGAPPGTTLSRWQTANAPLKP